MLRGPADDQETKYKCTASPGILLEADAEIVPCEGKRLASLLSDDEALRHSSAIIATCRRLLEPGRDRHLVEDSSVSTNYTRAKARPVH